MACSGLLATGSTLGVPPAVHPSPGPASPPAPLTSGPWSCQPSGITPWPGNAGAPAPAGPAADRLVSWRVRSTSTPDGGLRAHLLRGVGPGTSVLRIRVPSLSPRGCRMHSQETKPPGQMDAMRGTPRCVCERLGLRKIVWDYFRPCRNACSAKINSQPRPSCPEGPASPSRQHRL